MSGVVGTTFHLTNTPPMESRKVALAGAGNVFNAVIAPWFARARGRWEALADSDKRLVAAIKCYLIAGDVAGSALPRKVGRRGGEGSLD